MKRRVAESWDSFARAVLPPNVAAVQRSEMRRAFYAGVQCLLSVVTADLTAGPETSPEDEQIMLDLDAELRQFSLDVKEGRA